MRRRFWAFWDWWRKQPTLTGAGVSEGEALTLSVDETTDLFLRVNETADLCLSVGAESGIDTDLVLTVGESAT